MLAFLKRKLHERYWSQRSLTRKTLREGGILIYHDVSEPQDIWHNPDGYTTQTDNFFHQIAEFSSYCTWMSLDDLVKQPPGLASRPQVALTFDDGFQSLYDHVGPRLIEQGIPFTIFVNGLAARDNYLPVTTDLLLKRTQEAQPNGESNLPLSSAGVLEAAFHDHYLRHQAVLTPHLPELKLYMNTQELAELASNPLVTLANHTFSHPNISALSPEALIEQLESNQNYFQNLPNYLPDHFAIPFGKYNMFTEENLAVLADFGFRYVYTSENKTLKYTERKHNLDLVHRFSIRNYHPKYVEYMINRSHLPQG